MSAIDRRSFVKSAALVGAAALTMSERLWAATEDQFDAIRSEIAKRHDEALKRLQLWIHQPSIAAENNGVQEGCALTMQMLRDAGFQTVTKVPTDGQPGIFAVE